MPPLAPMPPTVVADAGRSRGLWSGSVTADPVTRGPRGGRVRRWLYAAAGEGSTAVGAGSTAVGAAVIDLGFASSAFVWALVGGEVHTWEAKRPARLGATVSRTPHGGAAWHGRETVSIDGDGGLRIDVPTTGGRLRVDVRATATTPATLVTDTPGGGWNCTEKAAGYAATGSVSCGDHSRRLDGAGWRDWTSGRQDRDTTWRWAAGAGTAADGRRVGLNVSTGMNGRADGEDVVWWDGVPYPLDLTALCPLDEADVAGAWRVAGPGWELRLDPAGVRAADEDLKFVVSRYTQPVGCFSGVLPDPDGRAVPVTLVGVSEHHEARW